MLGGMLRALLRPETTRSPDTERALPAERAEPGLEPIPAGARGPRDIVMTFRGHTRSSVLDGVFAAWRDIFARHGLELVVLDLENSQDDGERMMNLVRSERVAFGIGFAGAGCDITVETDGAMANMWELSGTPFFKLLGDHPSYFLDRHFVSSPWHVNVYGYPEHLRFWERHRTRSGVGGVLPAAPLDPLPEAEIDFAAKARGRIVFLKNGNDPEALRIAWRERLPVSVAASLHAIAETIAANIATVDRPEDLEAIVRAHFSRDARIDVSADLAHLAFLLAQCDDFARRSKSTMIARALLDLPIEVHGDLWGHVEFAGHRATLVGGGDYFRSRDLIRDSLAVIDMTPNTTGAVHERFVRAASRFTCCLTNQTDALRNGYPGSEQSTFRFTPDSIRERVSWALDHPADCVALGRRIGQQFAARSGEADFVRFFTDCADHLGMLRQAHHGIQDFVVWPARQLGWYR